MCDRTLHIGRNYRMFAICKVRKSTDYIDIDCQGHSRRLARRNYRPARRWSSATMRHLTWLGTATRTQHSVACIPEADEQQLLLHQDHANGWKYWTVGDGAISHRRRRVGRS